MYCIIGGCTRFSSLHCDQVVSVLWIEIGVTINTKKSSPSSFRDISALCHFVGSLSQSDAGRICKNCSKWSTLAVPHMLLHLRQSPLTRQSKKQKHTHAESMSLWNPFWYRPSAFAAAGREGVHPKMPRALCTECNRTSYHRGQTPTIWTRDATMRSQRAYRNEYEYEHLMHTHCSYLFGQAFSGWRCWCQTLSRRWTGSFSISISIAGSGLTSNQSCIVWFQNIPITDEVKSAITSSKRRKRRKRRKKRLMTSTTNVQ